MKRLITIAFILLTIGVVFLLSLTQGKSEAVNFDGMLLIKEAVKVSKKYNTCTSIEDDKNRLGCFDNLTNYIKEREKIYNKHGTTRDRVSAEFSNCRDMVWKGKGVKKKKLNCFMDLASDLESENSEAFIACKKKNFIRDKKNCFRDLARSLQTE
jgi:hypothetical protein